LFANNVINNVLAIIEFLQLFTVVSIASTETEKVIILLLSDKPKIKSPTFQSMHIETLPVYR
jgi:hypothetical protein